MHLPRVFGKLEAEYVEAEIGFSWCWGSQGAGDLLERILCGHLWVLHWQEENDGPAGSCRCILGNQFVAR